MAMHAEQTLQALDRQLERFERAAALPGRPRERIVAMAEAEELFLRLHPYHYRALQLVRVTAQFADSSRRSGDRVSVCESRVVSLVLGIVRQAVREGDLVLVGSPRPEELAFTLWALTFGTRALMETRTAVRQLGICDGFSAARQAATLLLDALGWRPLSCEWDYEQTRRRALTAILQVERSPEREVGRCVS
jgi:hypothetical protein